MEKAHNTHKQRGLAGGEDAEEEAKGKAAQPRATATEVKPRVHEVEDRAGEPEDIQQKLPHRDARSSTHRIWEDWGTITKRICIRNGHNRNKEDV